MTPMTIALMVSGVVTSLVVLWYCICAVNEMGPHTPHGQRLSVVMLAGGVFAELVAVLSGEIPSHAELLMLTGLMVLVRTNSRGGVCPCVVLPPWLERRKTPR